MEIQGIPAAKEVKYTFEAFFENRVINAGTGLALLYTIFVFDRGYASKNLFSFIEDTLHAGYLFRLRSKFNTDIDALPVPADRNGISDYIFFLDGRKVRILKFYLPSGTVETLITNDFVFCICLMARVRSPTLMGSSCASRMR